jgi:hypothetical protein
MSSVNTLSSLNGFFKTVYGDSLINLIPENVKLLNSIPFEKRKKLGDFFEVPIVLQPENGFTYNDGDGTAFALKDSNAMGTRAAKVRGAEKVLRSQISYKAAAAATSSKEAFADATSTLFENMVESMANRLELSCFYGGSPVAGASGSGSTTYNANLGAATYGRSGTTVTVTTAENHGLTSGDTVNFTDDAGNSVALTTGVVTVTGLKTFTATASASGSIGAGAACTLSPIVVATSTTAWIYVDKAEWSLGMWSGTFGATLNVYQDDDSTLVSSGADSVFKVSAIDSVNKRIKVTGTATGITALIGVAKANFDGGLKVYFDGSKGKDFLGVDKIITTSGTLFNIDNTVYNLFKGNEFSISGALTFNGIISATENAVAQGLQSDVTAYIPVNAWNKLMTDQAALRSLDASYKNAKAENGMKSIEFYGANGKIEIEPHPILKSGEIFIIPKKEFIRVGATDVTFQTPGMDSEEIFLQLPSNAGYEVRAYADQALLCKAPSKCTKVSGFNV